MEKRQKIILAVMTLTILYGLFQFLFISPADTNSMVSKTQIEGLKTSISSLALSLSAGNLSDAEGYIIDISDDEWQKNPFKELLAQEFPEAEAIVPLKVNIKEEETLSVFIFSGFLSMGDNHFAIINGLEYETGDELETDGYIVQQIKSDEVLLKKANEDKTISVILSE